MRIPSFHASYVHQWVVIVIAVVMTMWLGMNVAHSSHLMLVAMAFPLFLIVSTIGRWNASLFLFAAALLITGYATQGRGFAYFGVAPFYVGELVLLIGVSSLLFVRSQARLSRLDLLIVGFMVLGLAHTLPYIDDIGLQAIRDAATWYYATFAIVIGRLITIERLHRLTAVYSSLLGTVLLWILLMSTLLRTVVDRLPHFPGSPLPILSITSGSDRAVVLTGIAVFALMGLYRRDNRGGRLPDVLFWGAWLASALIMMIESRGAFLGLAAPLAVVFVLRPSVEWAKVVFIGFMALAVLVVIDPSIELSQERTLSVDQLAVNVQSIISDDTENTGGVQGNKDWRTDFWAEIYRDTVEGPLFWSGTGFGENLVSKYGYIGQDGESLRSPHSIHVTILARMGVPGAILWFAFLACFFAKICVTIQRCKRAGDSYFFGVLTWLLAMWTSALVVASFSPYLEGPQGAIPFWCIVGTAIAAMTLADQEGAELFLMEQSRIKRL